MKSVNKLIPLCFSYTICFTGNIGKGNLLVCCVTNNQTDIVVVGEADCSRDLPGVGDFDSVAGIISNKTGTTLCQEGVTALIGKELLHYRGG